MLLRIAICSVLITTIKTFNFFSIFTQNFFVNEILRITTLTGNNHLNIFKIKNYIFMYIKRNLIFLLWK